MSVTGMMRGYPTHYDGERWLFSDTGQTVEEAWRTLPCGHCGMSNTPEGHDGCLGTLPGVVNACCGHGVEDDAYVQPSFGPTVRGSDALKLVEALKREGGDSE